VADPEFYSLTEFTAYAAGRGVKKSRVEWQRRMRAGQFGRKIGTQWVIGAREAEEVVGRFLLAKKDS
jgi:hypothetical protein